MVRMPCAAIAAMCSARSRRASRPPCTAGWRVFTRPSSISGDCVIALTSRQGSPPSRIARAVPPVETSSQPSVWRPAANSVSPVLSDTERRARGTEERMKEGWVRSGRVCQLEGKRVQRTRIEAVLDGEDASREGLLRITRLHADPLLRDDGTAVVCFVHEVDGDATLRVAGGKDRGVYAAPIHARSPESWQ